MGGSETLDMLVTRPSKRSRDSFCKIRHLARRPWRRALVEAGSFRAGGDGASGAGGVGPRRTGSSEWTHIVLHIKENGGGGVEVVSVFFQ
jgi:hypothetical protein